VNLGEAGIAERRSALVGPIGGGDVAALRVGREVKDVPVPPGREDHCICQPGLDRTGHQIPGHDPSRHAIDGDQIKHLMAGKHRDGSRRDLTLQRLIAPQQQLLAGLSPRIEGSGDLGATE
jgi:hypothetical protein